MRIDLKKSALKNRYIPNHRSHRKILKGVQQKIEATDVNGRALGGAPASATNLNAAFENAASPQDFDDLNAVMEELS